MTRLVAVLSVLVILPMPAAGQDHDVVVRTEFLYTEAPFPSAHASTIAATDEGLVAAWFGGTAEGDPDVAIWISRQQGGGWSPPVEVANGVQPGGRRYPCWNPVLFQVPSGPLLLFYKVGPSPREWWGLVRRSSDGGRTWSDGVVLPDGILGPIRAKPHVLADGALLAGSSTEHDGWVAHMERFDPRAGWTLDALADAASWTRSAPLNDREVFGAIQPTILDHGDGRLQVLCRSRQGVITQAWSSDGGAGWETMTRTTVPNPSAGIDALRLTDGRFVLVYNPTRRGRRQLALAVSADGRAWRQVVLLEDAEGEYSYPAVIQTDDGLVHVTYTWRRERIKHIVLDPSQLH